VYNKEDAPDKDPEDEEVNNGIQAVSSCRMRISNAVPIS
jgi:hypothetical protein